MSQRKIPQVDEFTPYLSYETWKYLMNNSYIGHLLNNISNFANNLIRLRNDIYYKEVRYVKKLLEFIEYFETKHISLYTLNQQELVDKFFEFIGDDPKYAELRKFYDAGWSYYYFTFINPDHIYMKARFGKLELNPKNFELAARLPLNRQDSAIYTLCNTHYGSDREKKLHPYKLLNKYDQEASRVFHPRRIKTPCFGGWRSYQLALAIRSVSEVKFDVTYRGNTYGPYYGPSRRQICSRYVGANIKNLGKRMIGFGNNIYMPKFYYEAIYRALFHTPLTLDLALIAQKYLLNIVTITFILRYDYGISSESLSYVHDNDDLITIIENFRKNRLTSENNQILQRTKEEIKYQPGSLAYEAGASRFGQPEEGHRNLYQQSIYNTISEFCRTHDDPAPLYNYIRDLELEENILERFNVGELSQISFERLCSFITNYINTSIETGQIKGNIYE